MTVENVDVLAELQAIAGSTVLAPVSLTELDLSDLKKQQARVQELLAGQDRDNLTPELRQMFTTLGEPLQGQVLMLEAMQAEGMYTPPGGA
jgi:hypothetical protein